jgi:hypothetical protein
MARGPGRAEVGLEALAKRARTKCLLRNTHSGKTVAAISVASDRRDRNAPAVNVDLVVWEAQAEHLTKGQAVSFAGRFGSARIRDQRRREPARARAP